MAAAYADLDLVKHVLLLDHLPSAVGCLDGRDVDDWSSHEQGRGGEKHEGGCSTYASG
jgi:hypothetical protein